MIKTKEEVLEALATNGTQFVVDKDFYLEYARGKLVNIADRFKKNFVLLTFEELRLFKGWVNRIEAVKVNGVKGGRPRKPDLTPEEIVNLSPEARNSYKMRLWKRESRKREG